MRFVVAAIAALCLSAAMPTAEAQQLDTMIRLFLGGKDLGGPGGVQAIEKSLNDILAMLKPGTNTGTPGLGIMGIICKLQLPLITDLLCGDDDSTPELPDPVETDAATDICTLPVIGSILCGDDDDSTPELPDPVETDPATPLDPCKLPFFGQLLCPKESKPPTKQPTKPPTKTPTTGKNPLGLVCTLPFVNTFLPFCKSPTSPTTSDPTEDMDMDMLCNLGLGPLAAMLGCPDTPTEEPVEAPMKQKSPLTGVLDTATSKMFSKIVEMIDNLLQPIYGIIDGIGSPLLSRDLINKLTSGLFGNRPSTTGSTTGGFELPFGIDKIFKLNFGK